MSSQRRATGPFALGSLAMVGAGVGVLYFAREVLIPLAFALTLSFLLTPLVAWLQRLGLRRIPAVLIAIALTLSAAAGTGWIVATQLLDVAKDLPQYRLNIHNKLEAIRTTRKGALGRVAENIDEIEKEISTLELARQGGSQPAKSPTEVQVVQNPKDSLQYTYELLNPFLRLLGTFGIIVIFAIFILVNREDLRNRILRLFGLSQLNVMTQAFDDATQRVSRYLLMQFVVNAGFGALIGAGLFLIGVPSAVLWGVVAGLFRLVPYVGIMLAASLPLALSLAVFHGWLQPLLVFLLFAISEVILSNFVEPWLYGAHTGISSLALLVTTVLWALLWGPAGLVLSTPLTVCVVVLGRYVPQLSFLYILLGDEPVLEAEAQLFQRLLAMDLHEARGVVESFLKRRTLVELYDLLFIPALTMAEQDRHKGALDQAREEFIFLSINEMIAEFSEYKTEAAAPLDRRGRLICFAANDHADEIAAAMLAQLLEQAGYGVVCFPAHSSLEALFTVLAPDPDDILCISSLPPFAFASARTLCQKLRQRFPQVKIIAGIWGFSGDPEKAKSRFEREQPDRIATTLAEALSQVSEFNRRDSAFQASTTS